MAVIKLGLWDYHDPGRKPESNGKCAVNSRMNRIIKQSECSQIGANAKCRAGDQQLSCKVFRLRKNHLVEGEPYQRRQVSSVKCLEYHHFTILKKTGQH